MCGILELLRHGFVAYGFIITKGMSLCSFLMAVPNPYTWLTFLYTLSSYVKLYFDFSLLTSLIFLFTKRNDFVKKMQQWKKLASSSVLLSFNLRKYSVLTINHVSHNIYNAECYAIILHTTDNFQDKYGGLLHWAQKAFDKWDIPEIAAHFPSTFPAPYLSHSRTPWK